MCENGCIGDCSNCENCSCDSKQVTIRDMYDILSDLLRKHPHLEDTPMEVFSPSNDGETAIFYEIHGINVSSQTHGHPDESVLADKSEVKARDIKLYIEIMDDVVPNEIVVGDKTHLDRIKESAVDTLIHKTPRNMN